MKKLSLLFLLMMIFVMQMAGQKVGIGTTTPVTTLNLIGAGASPTIPGNSSTGIFRIGINNNEAIDIGKMEEPPFSGWLQSGYNGSITDPLCLQPLGGQVGIGTNTPAAMLTLIGPAGNPSIPNMTSTGIFRIGLNASEGIDMGKMDVSPFAGWIQVGVEGELADPLCLQPSGGRTGIGTSNPATSAVLDVSSTSKGFLPPRMTLANRNSISSPVAGLTVWCNNCGIRGQLQVYDGVMWTNMTGSPAVGLPAPGVYDGGGIIAYILQAGDPGYVAGQVHGLIATLNDQAANVEWGCYGINIPGAAGTALGTGNQNTMDITSGCASSNIAARICNNLVSGGYSDWYLPSKDELNKLYLNKDAIGGFIGVDYWSSSEVNSDDVWLQDFINGDQVVDHKFWGASFRAIRSF